MASRSGYILEVDLDCPREIHDLQAQFPFAPETRTLTPDMLSPYSKSKLTVSNYKAQKLIGSFESKKNYIIHFSALQQCLSHGLRLSKVHRIMKFRQFTFLKPYIEHTAALRASLSSSFEKNCMKLMANSLYGKTIEDPTKYTKLSFCTVTNSLIRCASSPFFKHAKIFSPSFAICFMDRESVQLKQCHAVGLSILDYSKAHMYTLFYDRISPLLNVAGGGLKVVMSDTDSFLLAIETDDTTAGVFRKLSPVMDFSNYPPDHQLFSLQNKGKLGFLKDEMKGEEISEACAIRSKCYSILSASGSTQNRCKGCPTGTTRKFSFDTYKDTIQDRTQTVQVSFFKIRSRDHQVTTQLQRRAAFSAFDDKRFYTCPIHSVPYGHYQYVNNEINKCVYC